MRRCGNPGRWTPPSATTSIPRSTMPTTGIRRVACPAVGETRARASMSRGWFRRSWAPASRWPISGGVGRSRKGANDFADPRSIMRCKRRDWIARPRFATEHDPSWMSQKPSNSKISSALKPRKQRTPTKTCCTAAAGATPWLRKTHSLDKSFWGHRQSLCYKFRTGTNPVLNRMPD